MGKKLGRPRIVAGDPERLVIINKIYSAVKGGMSTLEAAKREGISSATYHFWKKGLGLDKTMKLQRRKHGNRDALTREEKMRLVYKVQARRSCGLKVYAACKEEDVATTSYYNWIKECRLSKKLGIKKYPSSQDE